MKPLQLFDPASSTYTYVLFDQASREAVIIDPVDEQIERDLATLREYGLRLLWTVETHAHADHITSAGKLAELAGARTAAPAGCGIGTAAVQLQNGDTLSFGSQTLKALHTPGHTAGSMSYVWGDHVFTGDTLLINGCGRTDFQSGSAHDLYRSLTQVLFALPDHTTVWPGHDYQGRTHSTIAQEKATNARVAGKSEAEFVAIMDALQLPKPRRIDEAVPANLTSGLRHDAEGALLMVPRVPTAGAQAYAGDVSPQLAWQWVQSGEAVLVDVRTDAEREWVGFVPEAVPVAWKQWPGMALNPTFDARSRPRPRAEKWCSCAAAGCVRWPLPSGPPSWASRPTTSWRASRAIPTPAPIGAAAVAGATTVCPGARTEVAACRHSCVKLESKASQPLLELTGLVRFVTHFFFQWGLLFQKEISMETLEHTPVVARRNPTLAATLQQRIERDFQPRWQDNWGGKFVLHGRQPGPNAVRLDGNDYLSVTGHPDIVGAQVDALTRNNEFVVQSGVFLLQQHPTRALEMALADWVGKEDAFVCQSGYSANVGLLQAIADANTPVFLDTMAHTSLWEGAHAARAPAYAFRHNDPEHLDRMLAKKGPGVVVVDSVYSTTGALCPLEAMIEVVEKHQSMILVDESHSLGTHGPGGAGLCAELGLTDRVHFITASLAKAVAGRAGFFTAPASMRYYILSSSYPNIFSSCLLPHEVAGLKATVGVLQKADVARDRLRQVTRRLRDSLTEMGYPIHQGTEQIISLEAGTEPETMRLRDALEERGVFGAIFCAPATSRNRAMVRLTLSASLTEAEIEHVENVAREIAPIVKPWDWPIARRARMGAAQES